MAFVNPASAVIVGAVDSHHLLGLYPSAHAILDTLKGQPFQGEGCGRTLM